MVFVDGFSSVPVDTAFAPKVQINTGLMMIFVDDLCRWSLLMVFVDGLSSVHLLRSAVDTAFAPKVQINTGLLMVVDAGLLMVFVDDVSNVFSLAVGVLDNYPRTKDPSKPCD